MCWEAKGRDEDLLLGLAGLPSMTCDEQRAASTNPKRGLDRAQLPTNDVVG